ncbi:MAG: hypothetical protein NUV80_00345 [Candidatus Berkelbacteria bacterium]|nr:hypothetical protein [Candidatus Berkelbacteria bacterium]
MSEIPGPPEEEIEPKKSEVDPKGEERPPTDDELTREFVDSVDSDEDESSLAQAGDIREPMPGVRLDPNETGGASQYTESGIKRERQLAIERFVQDECVDLKSYAIGAFAISEGVICTDIDMRVGIVIDRRLESDPELEADLKTQVVLTLRYPDGIIKEVKYAKPAYEQMRKLQIPEAFADSASMEIGNNTFKLGQYVDVVGIDNFVGQVALILDQEQYPEMIGVMFVGTVSTDRISQLFAVPASRITPRG